MTSRTRHPKAGPREISESLRRVARRIGDDPSGQPDNLTM